MSGVDIAIHRVRAVYGSWRRDTPVVAMREAWDALFAADAPADAPLLPVQIGELNGAWVRAPGCSDRTALLYFHGGGFRVGSIRSHHRLMADLSRSARVPVLGIDYRLAPEHLYPAALEDALTAWQWLRDDRGLAANDIAIAGDSAGGALALLLMLRLRDTGANLPAAALLFSPWTDLSASGESYVTRAEADPIHNRALIRATAAGYLGGADAHSPGVSPLFADPTGLPPMLLQVGDRETVVSDTTEFAERARTAGVDATAQVWPDMIHVFQQFPEIVPDAAPAITQGAAFLRRHLMETNS